MTILLTPEASNKLAINVITRLKVYLFPIKAGAKFPPMVKDNLADNASNDPEQIAAWVKQFSRNGVGPNWGIASKKSNKFIVDVDTNPAKNKIGQQTYDDLDLMYGFTPTFTVTTPSGGMHRYYEGEHVFALGKYGLGLDVDSPNYVLVPGCTFLEKDGSVSEYVVKDDRPIAPVMPWVYYVIKNAKKERLERADEAAVEADKPENIQWAIDYLVNDAEAAIEGQGGEQTTYKVACSVRDKGVSREKCKELMWQYYNVEFTCEPLWDAEGLNRKIDNAYDYANMSMLGGKTAEADFIASADDDDAFASEPIDERDQAEIDKSVEEGKLKAEIAKANSPTPDKPKPDDRTRAVAISKRFAYVADLDRWVKLDDTEKMWKHSVIDSMYKTMQDKKESLAQRLLAANMVRKYESVAYLPGRPTDCRPVLNLYTASDVVPAPGDTSWWDDHLEYLFPDPIERGHVLNWMAWLLQNIGLKPKHALLIQGAIQGTGKSFLADMLTKILHKKNVKNLNEDDLHNQFNPWAIRSKLLVVEELRAVERQSVKAKLHTIITQETISCNEKGISQRDITNCFGIFAMTNSEAAVELDNTDRRYLVVQTKAIPRDKPEYGEGFDPRYYDTLYARLNDPASVAAVADILLKRDLQGYDGRNKAPDTAAKQEMIKSGQNDLESFIRDKKVEYPLNGRLVTVQDVIDILPKRLERSSRLHSSIVNLIKKHCGAEEAGQFRLKDGTRPRLYFINGSGLRNIEGWRNNIAGIYEGDQRKGGKRDDASTAEDDFGVGGGDD